MQTFNELLLPDQTLYAINTNGDVCKLTISGICERMQLGKKMGSIFGYYVLIYFLDESDSKLYKFFLPAKDINESIKLTKVYFSSSKEYKDTKNPYYLIGTDKIELIKYYIEKLDESIIYQNEVVNDGLAQIRHLQNTKDKLYEILKSST
jgi:hypothetical protein